MVMDVPSTNAPATDGSLTAAERERFGIPSCVRLEISIHDKFHLRRVAAELMSLATDLEMLARQPHFDALNCAIRADSLIAASKLKTKLPAHQALEPEATA